MDFCRALRARVTRRWTTALKTKRRWSALKAKIVAEQFLCIYLVQKPTEKDASLIPSARNTRHQASVSKISAVNVK